MKIPEYFVTDKSGKYTLGVNTLAEAIFAATGDRRAYLNLTNSVGTPSVIEEFIEATTEYGNSWDSEWDDLDLETLKYRLEDCLPAYRYVGGEFISLKNVIETYVRDLFE